MSPEAQQRWRDSLWREANKPELAASTAAGSRSAQLDLLPQTKEEQAVGDALLMLEPHQRGPVMQRFRAIQPLLNHDFAAMGYQSPTAYKGVTAGQLEMTVRNLDRIRAVYQRNFAQGGYAKAIAGLATEKPGPERGLKIDASMGAFIALCWIDRRLTRRQTWRALKDYVETKQRGTGGSFVYPEIPSYQRVARYVNRELGGDSNPLRNGAEAVKETAGYICRSYDDERAGDAWCLDEWELDCYCFDDRDHRVIYNYGRRNPVLHLLSVIDERTTFIMRWILTASVDSDTLELAEQLVRQYWLPLRLVCDRAGRFRALAHGSVVARETGELAEKLMGPLGELGVRPRGSEEKNPRANRIERMHGLYADRARRDFGPSWRPPKRVRGLAPETLRETTGIDARVEAHLGGHCKRGEATELLPLSQVERLVAAWIEEINNAETEAKGCNGLTRVAAFRQFQPAAEDIARRRPPTEAIDLAFAEKLERVVRGGSVIVWGDELQYSATALADYIGEELPAMRYRRDKSRIIVQADGELIEARLEPEIGTADAEALSAACEERARRRRSIASRWARGGNWLPHGALTSEPVMPLPQKWAAASAAPRGGVKYANEWAKEVLKTLEGE
jgi:hypothetical protein